jgi:spore coat protein CotF
MYKKNNHLVNVYSTKGKGKLFKALPKFHQIKGDVTMPFGAHETMEVHEALNEKINMINHFGLYSQQTQNEQLRQMIQRHLQTAVQSYDQLVSYTHDYQSGQQRKQAQGMINAEPQSIQYGLNNPQQQSPQLQGQLNDNQIAWALLCCHKNSAKNAMNSALECADPNIREMMIMSANTCANHAYEVFLFMNQQGQYQVPTMQDNTAKTFLHTYQPVQTQGIQQ